MADKISIKPAQAQSIAGADFLRGGFVPGLEALFGLMSLCHSATPAPQLVIDCRKALRVLLVPGVV